MTIELFLILFLEAEQDLDWTRALRHLTSRCDNSTCRVLEDVGGDILASDRIFCNTFLVDPHLLHLKHVSVENENSYEYN